MLLLLARRLFPLVTLVPLLLPLEGAAGLGGRCGGTSRTDARDSLRAGTRGGELKNCNIIKYHEKELEIITLLISQLFKGKTLSTHSRANRTISVTHSSSVLSLPGAGLELLLFHDPILGVTDLSCSPPPPLT